MSNANIVTGPGRRSERILQLVWNKQLSGLAKNIIIKRDKTISPRNLRPRHRLDKLHDDDLDQTNLDKTNPLDETYYPSSEIDSSDFSSFTDTTSENHTDQLQYPEFKSNKCATISKDHNIHSSEYVPNKCGIVQTGDTSKAQFDISVNIQPEYCSMNDENTLNEDEGEEYKKPSVLIPFSKTNIVHPDEYRKDPPEGMSELATNNENNVIFLSQEINIEKPDAFAKEINEVTECKKKTSLFPSQQNFIAQPNNISVVDQHNGLSSASTIRKTHTYIPASDDEDSLVQRGPDFNIQRYVFSNDYSYYMRLSNTGDDNVLNSSIENVINNINEPTFFKNAIESEREEDSVDDSVKDPIYEPDNFSSISATDSNQTNNFVSLSHETDESVKVTYNDSEEEDLVRMSTRNRALKVSNHDNIKPDQRIREKDFCFYCEQLVLNFARHVIRNHTHETEVQKILSAPKKSKSRKILLTDLRKKGNFILNADNCVKPMKKTRYSQGNEYLPCDKCLGFYSRKQLWKHKQKCGAGEINIQVNAQNFLVRNLNIDQRLQKEVFPRMRPDKISLEAKKDGLICAFGAQYLRKHREKHFVSVTSRKMRELAKLIIEIKKKKTEIKKLIDVLKPQYYDTIVMAAKSVAKYDTSEDRYESPTYAMNIATSIKQACNIALMEIYKTERCLRTAETEADLKTLTILIDSHWKFDVSSRAADDLHIKKWNKITIVPLANDLKLFKDHLCNIAKQSIAKLLQSKEIRNDQAFNDLIESIYCRVILLNRRRPGELQRVLLKSYEKNYDDTDDFNGSHRYEEFDRGLTTTEKMLVKTFKRIVIRGKRGRGVPVLFSREVQNDLKVVIDLRHQYIPTDNIYLFSKAGGSILYGYKILEKQAKLSGAKNPKSLTSTRLRKHLATLTQLFDMSESDKEQLATFMGHTMSVHKENYRLPSDVFQTAKISKLLMLMEDGKADVYHGKTLNEIDLHLEEEVIGEEIQNEDILDLAGNMYYEDIASKSIGNVTADQNSVDIVQTFDQKSVKCSEEQETYNEPIKKKRRLVPWTSKQKEVVTNYFKQHIRKKKPPKRGECEALKAIHSDILQNKDWLKIKVFIQNIYSKQ